MLEVDPLECLEALGQLGDLFALLARALVEASDLRVQREDQTGRLAPAAVRVLFEEPMEVAPGGVPIVHGAVGEQVDDAESEEDPVGRSRVGPESQDLAVERRRPGVVAGGVQGVGALERPAGGARPSRGGVGAPAGEALAAGEARREDGEDREDREGQEGREPAVQSAPILAGAAQAPGTRLADGRVDGSPPARGVGGGLVGPRRSDGELQQEAAASALPVLDADAPPVVLEDGAGDGQS